MNLAHPTATRRTFRGRSGAPAFVVALAAALGAFCVHSAHAQGVPPPTCAVSPLDGSVVDCTGNQSAGVALNDGSGPFRTLNVFDLTTNIIPASGIGGVVFTSDGDVTLNVDTDPFRIATTGDSAPGIFAASTNGGVSINAFAAITTTGNLSHGIAAQTITGAIDIIAAGSIATSGNAIGVSDGAFGIAAQSASGNINIVSAADITTTGIQGVGIFAGTTGVASVISAGDIVTRGDGAAGIAAAGDAGVAVLSSSNIRTYGDSAPGIAAYADGDIAVASSGDITTTGSASDGITAVSDTGMLAVTSSGDISATGTNSAGIRAGSYLDNVITNFGSVVGGSCNCAAGIDMMSITGDSTLINFGSIAALSEVAIYALSVGGSTTVENFGTVTGDVELGGTSAIFNNHAGALFNSGATVDAGTVTNDGTLAPGGAGLLQNTALGDNFIQNSTGKLAIELLGAGGYSDQVTVSGTAALAGNVVLSMLLAPVDPIQSFVILTAIGGTANDGLGLIASPALHASLSFPNANDVVLGINIDFTTTGLNPNQRAIADHLDQILAAGSGSVGPVLLGLLNVDSLAEYKAALDQLSPELYSDAEIGALYSSLAFTNSLLSCKVNGADTASIVREGQCLWAGASAVFLDAGTTSDQVGFSETAGLFTAGAQVALDEVWRLGFGAGYQASTLQTATGAQSEGALGQGGVSIKYNPGPLLLAGVVSGGGGSYDTTRPLAFGGFTGAAEGDQSLGLFSGALRAAYVLGHPHLYFKPILDMSLTHLQLGGFTETGGGGAALAVAGSGQTVFSLAPTLEVGSEWWMSNGTLVRPLIRAGAIWYDGADFALTASFAGAPVGLAPFTVNTDIDEVMGLVGAGVDVISGTDAVLRLSYDGQLGETTQIHAVGIKGSARF